ncbi:hypothetical protein FQN49_007934, partial [Arthroderma sp. PD_2]
ESTGAVCVDTLKRDWDSTLTLKDVLVTISCLLIHPNPDSALNSTAGALLQDNYESFARQAKLMTSIHAPIPADMKDEVIEARRGADEVDTTAERESERQSSSSKDLPAPAITMKRKQQPTPVPAEGSLDTTTQEQPTQPTESDSDSDADSDSENSASKENDPTLSSSPVIIPARSPRSVLGKRPLSVLSAPEEPELILVNDSSDDEDTDPSVSGMTASEKNVAANTPEPVARNRSNSKHHTPSLSDQSLLLQPRRKVPKLFESAKRPCVNVAAVSIFSKSADKKRSPALSEGGKPLSPVIGAAREESSSLKQMSGGSNVKVAAPCSTEGAVSRTIVATLTKPAVKPAMSNLTVRPKPRTGLRRL